MTTAVVLSVIIPVWNEQESVTILSQQLGQALADWTIPWEVIWIDDGSSDDTNATLRELPPPQRQIRLIPHSGKSAAYKAGIEAAQGQWIATLDGDGQNRPEDIPLLFTYANEQGLDVVVGIRKGRKDSLNKRISSRLGNWTRRLVLGDRFVDVGCGLRLGRIEAFKILPAFEGMHRFIPVFMERAGYKVGEHPVTHQERQQGKSKFGISNRFPAGLIDLFGVWWLLRRQRRWTLETAEKAESEEKE